MTDRAAGSGGAPAEPPAGEDAGGSKRGRKSKRDQGSTIPVSKVARTAVLAATAAKVGGRKLGLLAKRPLLSREAFQELKIQQEAEAAALWFEGLGALKGSALKVAQFLSLELGLLSEAHRAEFYKSHYRAPPLNRAVVRQVILRELGRPPEEIFESFDPIACAAASLGQVHRARSRAGEPLAVKVQYPGIDIALRNDMDLVWRFVLPRASSRYLTDMIREVDVRLSEEVDYALERKNTEWFHEHIRIPEIECPRTFGEYSSRRVLTTGFLEGVHLDQWLAAGPSQAARNRVAQLIYDFFVCALFEFQRMHADPNPGNYLIRSDDTVAVVDFGSVKLFTPDVSTQLLNIWRASIHDDLDAMVTGYCAFGMAGGDPALVKEACLTHLAPFREWMSTPFREDSFDFGSHAKFSGRGARLFRDVLAFREMDGFTAEPALFYRTIHGLFRLFTVLGARVHMKNRWAN